MVLSRPVILAVTGLALVVMAFSVIQRQRVAPEPAPVADRVTPTEPNPVAGADPRPAKPAKPGKDGSAKPKPDRRPGASKDKPSAPAGRPSKPAPALAPTPARAQGRTGVPAAVRRALANRQVTVLLFTAGGAADDAATRTALESVRGGKGKKGVAVFVDGIGNVGRYSEIVGTLGISQVPSLVIVDRAQQARLLEGYVDAGTLRQYVADAQR